MPAKDTTSSSNNAGSVISNGEKLISNSSSGTSPPGILSPEVETKLIRRDVDNLVQNIKDNLKLEFDRQQAVSMAGAAEWRKACEVARGVASDLQVLEGPPAATWQPASHLYGGSGSAVRKARSFMSSRGSSRTSPYSIPGSAKCGDCCDGVSGPGQRNRHSWAARKRYPSMSANGGPSSAAVNKQKQTVELDDPLEMLQELISEGNLLKEAVRRLQLGLTPKIQNRNFYDSDDEGGCRSPPTSHYTEICQLGIN